MNLEVVAAWKSAELYWRDPKKDQLDILLIDIMLADMNGVELAGIMSLKYPQIKKSF